MAETLFTPLSLPSGGITLRNRLVLAPMTTWSSLPSGEIAPDELEYLRARSRGYGLVTTAACYVHPRGKAFDGQWACSSDGFLPSLASAAEGIHSEGAAAFLQIHHGGRACPSRLCGGPPLSASAVPAERPDAEVPSAMTLAEIEDTIGAFGEAALRAKKAGYDGVEIHGANTYLLQQFVSPHSNRREDDYGLDPLLFPSQVVDSVMAAVGPNFPIGYRFSPEETETPGIRLPLTLELIERLITRPLAYLHISLRDFRAGSMAGDFEDSVLTRVATAVAGRVPFIGVGSVKTAADAEEVLSMGADLVAVGRSAIADPDWALKVLSGEAPDLTVPRTGTAEKLNLPKPLAERVVSVPGWFNVVD